MMSRRVNLLGLCTISISFFVLIFFATKSSNYDDYRKETSSPFRFNKNKNYYYAVSDAQQQQQQQFTVTQNLTVTIEDVLNYQRQLIADEMANYEFPNGRFGVDAKNLAELQMEQGGAPMRSIVVSSWRSGTTFLGDVLNSLPGNYYHYEPLLTYEIIKIRGPPNDKPAIKSLKKMLKCNYTGLDEYLEFGKTHTYLFSHNTRLWNQCHLFPQFCYQPKFLEPFCKLFPLQSMKVVRLRMRVAANLLRDSSLNVRIVLLIRDPRGFLQSRKHRNWCPGNPDCDNPTVVCKDMVSDYKAAVDAAKKFPMTFKVVRYEDLSMSPYETTQEILQFYGLAFDERVTEFLDSHTKTNEGGVSSTFRDSKQAPFHWAKDLSWNEVSFIQDSCKEALHLWGYKEASNASELLQNFNPLLPFPDFDFIAN